jgi:hypothetical protein
MIARPLDTEGLRYDKVILATNANADTSPIREIEIIRFKGLEKSAQRSSRDSSARKWCWRTAATPERKDYIMDSLIVPVEE